jgi:Secretion system C-terminal sorting domain
MDPIHLNFSLQINSPCRISGLFSYDLGAKFFDDIAEAPDSLTVEQDTTQNIVILEWCKPKSTVQGNQIDTLTSIHIWRNGELIAELNPESTNGRMIYSDQLPKPDYYRYQICVEDTSGLFGRLQYTAEVWMGGEMRGIIIWELDPTPITSSVIASELYALGYSDNVYIAQNSVRYTLENSVEAVFVCLGIYPNNHVLTEDEGSRLRNYLNAGGSLYMEGGDTWCYDLQTEVHPLFQINPISDGMNDLSDVSGQAGTSYQNYSFSYSGENSFIDDIDQTSLSTKILRNPSDNNGTAVMRSGDGFKTIGCSFEFGGLVDNAPTSTKRELLQDYLGFFGIFVTGTQTLKNNNNLPSIYALFQNYPNPFNPGTLIEFDLPKESMVSLKIFNILGEAIATLVNKELIAGKYKYYWDSRATASGTYFYRLETGEYIETRKMILLR